MSNKKSIVLVHGGFVNGAGWEGVYTLLKRDGFKVIIVQNPTITLIDDVAVTKRAIATAKHDVVLVGHSYGGAVITEAGNDPKVKSLVYITAFALDKGESVGGLIANPAPSDPVSPILPPVDGFLFLDSTKFVEAFADDVEREKADFMGASQVPWGLGALNRLVTEAAWNSKPTSYLVVTKDKMIPPAAQRKMATRAKAKITEVLGSHAVYVSNPAAVAEIIRQAAAEIISQAA